MTPEIEDLIRRKREEHPELAEQLTWTSLLEILRREAIDLLVRPLPVPAELVTFDGTRTIVINAELPPRHHTSYAAHELAHCWKHVPEVAPGEEICFGFGWPQNRDPREDEADYIAHALIYGPRFDVLASQHIALESAASIGKQNSIAIRVDGDGTFAVRVAETTRLEAQAALSRILNSRSWRGRQRLVDAVLIPDNSNPRDPKAVRVDIDGNQVGQLARDFVREHRRLYGRRTVVCKATVVIPLGSYQPSVRLDITYRTTTPRGRPSKPLT